MQTTCYLFTISTAVVQYVTHSGPEVLFQDLRRMKFVDDDDDDDDNSTLSLFASTIIPTTLVMN